MINPAKCEIFYSDLQYLFKAEPEYQPKLVNEENGQFFPLKIYSYIAEALDPLIDPNALEALGSMNRVAVLNTIEGINYLKEELANFASNYGEDDVISVEDVRKFTGKLTVRFCELSCRIKHVGTYGDDEKEERRRIGRSVKLLRIFD